MECTYHPGREADHECEICGKPLCDKCGEVCEECLAQMEGRIKLMNWEGWVYSFLSPRRAFRLGRMNSSFAGVCMNLLVGLINAGIIAALLVLAESMLTGQREGVMQIFNYTVPFLAFLAIWFLTALLSYSFAMLGGGTGNIKQHFYVLSLPIPFSPLLLGLMWACLNFVFSLHLSLGLLATVIAAAYVIQIQMSALREAHGFGTLQAAIGSIMPILICAIMLVLIFVGLRK